MSLSQKRTKRIIIIAFQDLLYTHMLDSITVNDICEKAMIHRSSFYRYFEDKYDLLNEFTDYLGILFLDYLKEHSNKPFHDCFVDFIYPRRRIFINTVDKFGNPNQAINEALAHVILKRGHEISNNLSKQINNSTYPQLYARFFAFGLGDVMGICLKDNKITKKQLKMFIKELVQK